MKELWLNYENKDGEPEEVLVEQDVFVIGRHSSSDLSIASGKLSREHAKIDKFGEVYILSDLDSSNGTILNGSEIDEPTALKNGDSIDFGGGLKVSVKLGSDEPEDEKDEEDAEENSAAASSTSSVSASASSGGSDGVPTSFFFLAPILGLVVLLCAGGGLFIAYSDGNGDERAGGDDYEYSTPDTEDIEDTPENSLEIEDTPKPVDTKTPEKPPEGNSEVPPTPESTVEDVPTPPKTSGEKDKARVYSASFLPRIVNNDPNAFLLDKHIQILVPKIKQFKSSSALASNFNQVNQNSSQIQSIANGAGLKPQFLATAALAKIGNNKGDVVATAKSMAETLQKLRETIGIESADDATVVVAAYPQGAAGQFTQMRTTIEVLSGQNTGVSARQIRTIWFLNQNGKLKPNEFDLALRFLAIGTIMQKPSEFNVKAKPVILN